MVIKRIHGHQYIVKYCSIVYIASRRTLYTNGATAVGKVLYLLPIWTVKGWAVYNLRVQEHIIQNILNTLEVTTAHHIYIINTIPRLNFYDFVCCTMV